MQIRYISWIYDSPAFDLYSPTILNDVNRIFVFDRGVSDMFQAQGITTVFHMPLGVYVGNMQGRFSDARQPERHPPKHPDRNIIPDPLVLICVLKETRSIINCFRHVAKIYV
ncbi:MAG: DUF3880 domain-containing protein [Lachnospiraceae bacterium]|nr:DUF3880 domain-containing protein [Lachnospiraceae bacterium]